MFAIDHGNPIVRSATRATLLFVAALGLTGALVLAGCDSTDTDDAPEIARVAMVPDSATMAVGESVDFSVVALTADGDTVRDADLDIEWWSTDPDVFTVTENGLATGQSSGTALCMVEATDEVAGKAAHPSAPFFVGRDSAFVVVLF